MAGFPGTNLSLTLEGKEITFGKVHAPFFFFFPGKSLLSLSCPFTMPVFSAPLERHWKGNSAGAVMPALLLVQVQRGMLTSARSAAITHLGITMASGRAKDVRPFLKEAFKVQDYGTPLLQFSHFGLQAISQRWPDLSVTVGLAGTLHKLGQLRRSCGFGSGLNGGVWVLGLHVSTLEPQDYRGQFAPTLLNCGGDTWKRGENSLVKILLEKKICAH